MHEEDLRLWLFLVEITSMYLIGDLYPIILLSELLMILDNKSEKSLLGFICLNRSWEAYFPAIASGSHRMFSYIYCSDQQIARNSNPLIGYI